jgi:hypothetical protein
MWIVVISDSASASRSGKIASQGIRQLRSLSGYCNQRDAILFSFVLRVKGLYMFRALLAHPQEALQNGTWYIACMLCQLAATGLERSNIPSAACEVPPEDEQVTLEIYRGP